MQKEALLRRIKNIPPVPAAISRIMTIVDKDETDAKALAQVIEYDAGLSGRVLRVANSAFFGLSSRVPHVQQAVVVLGFSEIKNLAVSIALQQHLQRMSIWRIIDSQIFWRHSLAVALAAQMLAKASNQDSINAFTLGMLHELGKCTLAYCFPEQYSLALNDNTRTADSAEKHYCGFNQATAGGYLCGCWKLPKHICEAIGQQNVGNSVAVGSSLGVLLKCANELAIQSGFSEVGNNLHDPAAGALLEHFSAETIESTLATLSPAVNEIEQFFLMQATAATTE